MSDDSFYIKKKKPDNIYEGADDFVGGITKNLKSEVIHTNKDKLELVLIKYEKKLKNKHGWATPFGLFITLLITLLTADKFNSFLGVPPEMWKSVVFLSTLISGGWLLISLIKVCIHWRGASIHKAIEDIMTPDKPPSY